MHAQTQNKVADEHRLWFNRPATLFRDALPIGNGRLGAMVYGDVTEERISLNEDTLFGGGPHQPGKASAFPYLEKIQKLVFCGKYVEADELARTEFMSNDAFPNSYQPIGDLYLASKGLDSNYIESREDDSGEYVRDLDLTSGIAGVRFNSYGIRYTRQVLASPTRQVMAVHIAASKPAQVSFTVSMASPHSSTSMRMLNHNQIVLEGKNGFDCWRSGALRFCANIKVDISGGKVHARDDHLEIEGADHATILIAIATSYRNYNDVGADPFERTTAHLDGVSNMTFEAIAEESIKAHRVLYNRMSLQLPASPNSSLPTDIRLREYAAGGADPGLEALVLHYGRYLLMASSRGSEPANLQGIWNDMLKPPWGSKYTININAQMNYWHAESSNLQETVEPLINLTRDLAVTGMATARDMYGARGWTAHHNTDCWRASAPIQTPRYGLWPTGGAWLCLHLWDHYEYSGDQAYLASIYPVLAGSCMFFLDTLVLDPKTGYMVTNPSISPENIHEHGVAICAGPAMDMQILRDLFAHTAAASSILCEKDEFRKQLQDMSARLAPSKIDPQGQLQEWQDDWNATVPEPTHRHLSHLFALYPSHQISPDNTPELAAAAEKSILARGPPPSGWSTAWRMNLWARLRNREQTYSMLRAFLSPSMCYNNLFGLHPYDQGENTVFQIDGNFGMAAGIMEMLVQSQSSSIILLPALPHSWPEGKIGWVRVRGAWEVEIQWRQGYLTRVTLKSSGIRSKKMVRYGEMVQDIELRQGEELSLDSRLQPV